MPPVAVANRGSRPSAGATLAARSQGAAPPQAGSQQAAAAFSEQDHPRSQSAATGGQFVRKGQGMSGPPDQQVAEVQRGINAAPNAQRVAVDGRFGPVTEEAVKTFQRQNGLNANGIVDPATRETMLNPPPMTAQQANAEIQATLHPPKKTRAATGGRAGRGSSGSGGTSGSGGSSRSTTRQGTAASVDPSDPQSIEEFQRAHGLKVDGIIGPDTQAMLRRSKDYAKTYGSTGRAGKSKASTKMTDNERLRLQELGYDTDSSGLAKLQQRYGLDPTGVLDDATRKLLHRKGSRLEAEQKGIARGKPPRDGIKLAEGLARAATTHVLQEAPYREAAHPRDRNGKWIKGAMVLVPTAARNIRNPSPLHADRGKVVEDKGDVVTVSVGGRERDVPKAKVKDVKGGDGMPPDADPEDRHGGFGPGDQVVWQNPMGIDKHPGEVVRQMRNGNLMIREPKFNTTVHVHHTKLERKNGNKLTESAEFEETHMTLADGLARAAETHTLQEAGPPAAKCAMDHKKMAKGKDKCPGCGMDLKPIQEAGTKPEPFSRSKTSNWVARSGGLPTYIQHVAHDIIESGSITDESHAIAAAISQAKKNAAKGNSQAAAAVAQWEAMKSRNKGKGKLQEAEVSVVGAMVSLIEAHERLSAADSSAETVRARAARSVAHGRLQEALGLADAEGTTSRLGDPDGESGEGEPRPAASWEEAVDSLNPGSQMRVGGMAVTRLPDGSGFEVMDLDGGEATRTVKSAAAAVSAARADDAEDMTEALFTEDLHPRDRLGKFMGSLGSMSTPRHNGRMLATAGLPIKTREVHAPRGLPAGNKPPTRVQTPSSRGDNGDQGTPRGTSPTGVTGVRTPTRGGTSGESSGTKPAWDTDANYQAFVKENLHAGFKAEQLTRGHFEATMARHDKFLADRKASMAADVKSGKHQRRMDEEAARQAASAAHRASYDWSKPENRLDDSPNEKATIPTGEPSGFHDRVAGLDAGGAVTLPGGTRVRRLIPTPRQPYPTWEVAKGGKRVTRRRADQASRIALRFDGGNPKEAGTGS